MEVARETRKPLNVLATRDAQESRDRRVPSGVLVAATLVDTFH